MRISAGWIDKPGRRNEREDTVQWRCKIGGRECGPFDDHQLKEMAATGQIAPADQIWNPASHRWNTADRLRGLFDPPASSIAVMPNPVANAAFASTMGAGGGADPVAFARGDAGPFVRLCDQFALHNPAARWRGTVILTPNALYLLKALIMGDLVVAAISGVPDRDVRSCRLDELPAELARQLNPKGWYACDSDVIILPRRAVQLVRHSLGRGMVVECGEDSFDLSMSILGSGSRQFEELGWTYGQEVEPEMEPLHAERLGRTAGEISQYELNGGQRLRAIIVFIAIVAGALLFRMWHGEGPLFR